MKKLLSLFVITAWAAVASSCADPVGISQDDGTAPPLDVAASAVGDRSEWVPLFTQTLAEGDFPNGFTPCINGGQGEEAWWVGTSTFLYKLVVTSSGNVNFNLKLELEDVRLVGWESGDVWTLERYVSHFPQHIKRADGHLYTNQADNEWFVNERTGERMKMLWVWRIEWDESFNVVSDESRMVSCARMGGR